MKITIQQLLDEMWRDYTDLNPEAQEIFDLFTQAGEKVVNDHIALRTFNHPKVNVDIVAKTIINLGYKETAEYTFEEKKLKAKHFEHSHKSLPKIFISQLECQNFSSFLQETVDNLAMAINETTIAREDFCISGTSWPISYETYNKLKAESEYAAWLYAHGLRVNHFTVYVNHLEKFPTIQAVNSFLKENGHQLNSSGGEIKGSPEVLLEQSSTLAYNSSIKFQEGEHHVPACYYEFALRYPDNNGKLFQGFVAKSADKIFESTNQGQ